MPLTIKFPEGTDSAEEKTAFLYRLQERLRLQHNQVGKKFRAGKISKMAWAVFLAEWDTKNNKVVNEILHARSDLKADTAWEIDLDQVFGE